MPAGNEDVVHDPVGWDSFHFGRSLLISIRRRILQIEQGKYESELFFHVLFGPQVFYHMLRSISADSARTHVQLLKC